MAGPITHDKAKWQAIRGEAAAWVVRTAARPQDAEAPEFQAWLDADLAHEIAFEQEQSTWRRADELAALRAIDPDIATRFQSDAADPPETASQPARRARPSVRPPARSPLVSRRAVLGGGLAAAGLAGVAIWSSTGSKAYATGVGERRTAQLTGNVRVELNTETTLVLHKALGAPALELRAGEALFNLKDAARPGLNVRAGAARMRGPGSTFSVRRDSHRVHLTVVDGVVEFLGEGSAQPVTLRLDQGSMLTLGDEGLQRRRADAKALERSLAWRYGKIALAGEPLGEAAAEFNRYNAKQIVVTDPTIAALSVGGYFEADDVDGFIRGVQQTFPVRAVERGRVVYLVAAS